MGKLAEYLFGVLRQPSRELRSVFLRTKEDFEAGAERSEWTKAVSEYDKLDYTKASPLRRLEELDRRYKVWNLEGKSRLQQALEKEELQKASLAGDVLRVRTAARR